MSRRPAKGDYIETVSPGEPPPSPPAAQAASPLTPLFQDTGNKVARKAVLVGTQNIMLGGKTVIQPDVMIRGDLVRNAPPSSSTTTKTPAPASTTAVAIGRYCFLSRDVHLRPPGRLYKGVFTHMPLRLGDHVFVGQGSVVQAATVGSHVHIGSRCAVNDFAIIKDYVKVLDDTVVPAFMVIPSFSLVAGQPAAVIGEIPEGAHDDFELRDLYKTVGNNPQPPAQ